MKKFLLIGSYADSILNFRGDLVQSLILENIDVHVAAPQLTDKHPIGRELLSRGVTIHEIPLSRTGMNPAEDIASLFSMLRIIWGLKPSWVLCYTIKPVVFGLLAARISRRSKRFALITGLGYAFQEQGGRAWVRFIAKFMYAAALSGSSKVFFQNPDDEQLFRSKRILQKSSSSCVVNGSGIALDRFPMAPVPAKNCFLLIARLLGDKGVREYVEAARRLRAKHPGTVCQLAGWIDENPDAISRDELDFWVASGYIEYLGKLNDVRPAISDCSIYVLPSYREGTPRTVLEAMAMGRAIITTDAPGCRETVIEGDNGFLVPVKSADALFFAMERFVLNSNLAAQMGKRSREIAVERYDVHKVNAVMLREMGIR